MECGSPEQLPAPPIMQGTSRPHSNDQAHGKEKTLTMPIREGPPFHALRSWNQQASGLTQ